MNETRSLVDFLSGLKYGDLPAEVVSTAKLCLLDIVGVGLCASQRPWSRMVAELASELGGVGESAVWGQSFRAPAQYAAIANGTAAHGIEMDDRRSPPGLHSGAMVISAALAAGEKAKIDGRKLITAIVAGYEAGFRVGYVGLLHPGLHPAGHWGIWNGVAAASKALDLNAEQMLDAFGIAGSMASGVFEFSQDSRGTMVKRLHGGWPAHNGVVASLLARKGLTGPATVLEGKLGYCNVFAVPGGEPDMEALTKDLGKKFLILDRQVKPYAAWGGSHTAIDAAARLRTEHGVQPQDIAKISIGGSTKLIHKHDDKEPRSLMAAQYSLPFVTAIALSRGAKALMDPDGVWTDQIFQDKEVRDLVDKTELHIDEELQGVHLRTHGYAGCKMTVTLKDGTQKYVAMHHSKGMLENPVTAQDIHDKFGILASRVLSEKGVRKVAKMVDAVEEIEDVRKLGDRLMVKAR